MFHVYNVFLVLYFSVWSEILDNYFNMAPFNLILFSIFMSMYVYKYICIYAKNLDLYVISKCCPQLFKI